MNFTEPQLHQVAAICRAHGVARLAAFGSRVSGGASEESDLDLLIEFQSGRAPGLIGLARLAEALSSALGGVEVDLRTPCDLSRHFRAEVLKSAKELYAA